ncbi:unnamed protein product, partial [Schistosoma mattheei]
MDLGKEQRISPRVYQLAQIIYREFEVIKKVYGESAYGGLVPIVVGILEEMDLLTVDKQKLDLDLNLLTAEKNDISVQLCRQKELYIAAKRHIHCLEDELLGMKKETDKKFEELEENSRHYQLLVKNANDHIFRLEEREQDLRSELSAQNERYTKLLKIYVDYIETNNLSVSNNDIESGTVCVGCEKDTESNELVMKSPVNSNPINENPNQISVESGYISNTNSRNHDISTIGINLTHPLESEHGVKALHSLDSSLKSNNGTASFIDIYDDIVDYETALESTPAMGTGDDVEEIGIISKSYDMMLPLSTGLNDSCVPTFTETDVRRCLQSLNSSRCLGPDDIPNLLFKKCAGVLCYPFTAIFNRSFSSNLIPKMWIKMKIIPVPKKASGDKNVKFRTVAITSPFLKTMEKLLILPLQPAI